MINIHLIIKNSHFFRYNYKRNEYYFVTEISLYKLPEDMVSWPDLAFSISNVTATVETFLPDRCIVT